MAGYFRLIPALRHPSFTQRKNSVFLCTRICGAGTKFALEAICLMKVRYFLVTIAVCLMLSVCSGCYGTGYDRSIPAMAYPSGNVLEISTGAELNPGTYIAYGANQFSADLSLSALVQRIYRDDAVFQIVSTPAQRNIGTLIWVPQGNGTRDVYIWKKSARAAKRTGISFPACATGFTTTRKARILFFSRASAWMHRMMTYLSSPMIRPTSAIQSQSGVRHGRIFCRKSRHFMRVQDILMLYGRIPFSRYAAKERPGIFPH